MPYFRPNPTILPGTFLSSGEMEVPAENAHKLYDAFRGWPAQGRYSHTVGGTFAYAQVNGVASLNWGFVDDEATPLVGWTYPIYGGYIYKTAGRDELYIRFLYQAQTNAAHRIDIYINATLAESITANNTSGAFVTKTYAIGAGNTYGVVDGGYYQVLIMATNVGTQRLPFSCWVDAVEGRIASGALPTGFPTLPTFTGASTLSSDDANTVIEGLDWLFNRLVLSRRVGFSGFLNGFMDSAGALVGNYIRHFNYGVTPIEGRRTLRIRGRLEGRGAQVFDLRVRCNNTTVWEDTGFTGLFAEAPWELDIDVSGASLVDGTPTRFGIDYKQVSGGHFPRPRVCLFEASLAGEDSSSTNTFTQQAEMAVGVDFDVRTFLQQLRTNTLAAKEVWEAAAPVIERDLPYSWQWDTSARFANHPGEDPNDVDRKEQNPVNGPVCFNRWGDVLHVVAIRPRIVWGPMAFRYEAQKGGDEKVWVEQPYEYVIDDDPDAITVTTIYLDAVVKDGAVIDRGQSYRLVADRILYAGEGLLS